MSSILISEFLQTKTTYKSHLVQTRNELSLGSGLRPLSCPVFFFFLVGVRMGGGRSLEGGEESEAFEVLLCRT